MTPPFNLPAPGRRQTLYVVFMTLQSPVFLVNSRLGPFTATRLSLEPRGSSLTTGTPSSKVTELFCRVPEQEFSLAP